VTGGDLLDCLDELPSLPKFLKVENDDRRVQILVKIEEQIQFVDVRLVADGDEFRKTEIPVGGKIENGRTERPALGDERNVSAGRHPLGKARVQTDFGNGIDHTQAVGADKSDPRLPADGNDLIFNRQPLAADFSEAGRYDHDPLDPLGDRLLDCREASLWRQDENRQINLVGDGRDSRIGFYAENGFGLRIDRV